MSQEVLPDEEVFPNDPDTPLKLEKEAAKRRGPHPTGPEAPLIQSSLYLIIAEHWPQTLSQQVACITAVATGLAEWKDACFELDINPLDKEYLLNATPAQVQNNKCFRECFTHAMWIAPGLFFKRFLEAHADTVASELQALGVDSQPVIELKYFIEEGGNLQDALRRAGRDWDSLCIRLRLTEAQARGQELRLQSNADLAEEKRPVGKELHAAEDTRGAAVPASENDLQRWRGERESLRRQAGSKAPEIVGESDAILTVWHEIYVATKSKERVLITGETGTGKLLAAKVIHYAGDRRNYAFERLDCGTLSDALAESELFGHVKGAFTGAVSDKKGRFELADRGTLCLEEVQNLSVGCQAKLLAVLDEHKFRSLGGQKDIAVDVRVIAVTNAVLDQDVKDGKFRQDLYGRLNVLRVILPPLRERQNDVRLLAAEFGQGLLEEQEINALAARDYPENVRGLSNEITRIIAGRRAADNGASSASAGRGRPKIDLTRAKIGAALAAKRTVRDAAVELGVSEDTLQRRMTEMGIPAPA